MGNNDTMIPISFETRDRIKDKSKRSETYDVYLNRLMDNDRI